jgi:predicted ATP-grasp superfamily ATP-dependent carboligase/2-polyprenyl-3-methyl-5-hydroxy-6-metoxy-1,4-benzoquinol methylase
MNRMILIFSGFNQRAIIAFIRTLVKNKLRFCIIALSENDPILLSEYKKNVLTIRKSKKLDLGEILQCVKQVKEKCQTDSLFIAPSTEALNRFLLKNRNVFEENGCEIPLVEEALYQQISDKESFGKLCQSYGIKVPNTVEFNKENIPFVVKPKFYETTEILSSPIIVDSEKVLNSIDFDSQNYYCQEYINGNSFYLLYYISKNKKIYRLDQENLLQQPQGKSIVAAHLISQFVDDRKFRNMFNTINFHGLVMIEIRIVNKEPYIIEANPRFWGPSQLFVDCGVNLFEYFLKDYDFKICDLKTEPRQTLYFWNGGMSSNVVYHNVKDFDFDEYIKYDIYKRPDTMEIYKQELINRLSSSYNTVSKHSQYQILPSCLTEFIDQKQLNTKSRAEQQRFDYITHRITLKGKSLIDIGANTGFFSFCAIEAGAKHVTSYEGNVAHAEFLSAAIELLELGSQMEVKNEYYSFNDTRKYDICFLLNVIHHLGDDYGDKSLSIEKAKEFMISQLNKMSFICETIVFQLGFNWKGDRTNGLFKKGTKQEMTEFIKNGTRNYWDIEHIGIAEKFTGEIVYKDVSPNNIQRMDELGEFLNRPIFIMKSRRLCKNG